MRKKAMTLVELLIVLIVMSGLIVFVSASLVFFVNQTQANLERSNIYTELTYTMEDMRLRCISAINLGSTFKLTGTALHELIFEGEADIYNITPDDTADNVWYKYYLKPDTSGSSRNDVVLMTCLDSTCSSASKEEVLIDKAFSPDITFSYTTNDPPNMLKVELTAISNKIPLGADAKITKTGGIRFWFIDVAE
ncbi:MAG: type II secretion system protein [Candidatus Omnitrophota bacterium]|jgi:prepilin-type N-terminal cleavage/methylation domain-containing protein